MKNEVKDYLSEVEIRLKDKDSIDEAFLSEMLTRIDRKSPEADGVRASLPVDGRPCEQYGYFGVKG